MAEDPLTRDTDDHLWEVTNQMYIPVGDANTNIMTS